MTLNQNEKLIEISNNTFLYQFQQFIVNPYDNDIKFSNFSNSINAKLIIPKLTYEKSQYTSVNITNPIQYPFNVQKKVYNKVKCASQVKPKKWQVDICKVYQNDTVTNCSCTTLSALSVIEALINVEHTYELLFEREIVDKMQAFPYSHTVFFYLLIFILLVYVITLYQSLLWDQIEMDNQQRIEREEEEKLKQPNAQQLQSPKNAISNSLVVQVGLIEQITTPKITLFQGYIEFIKHTHTMFEIYFRYDKENVRPLRLTVFFAQILGDLSIFTVFGQNLDLNKVVALYCVERLYGFIFQLVLAKMIKQKKCIVLELGGSLMIILTAISLYIVVAGISLYSDIESANIAASLYISALIFEFFIDKVIVAFIRLMFYIRFVNNPQNTLKKILEKVIPEHTQRLLYGNCADLQKSKRADYHFLSTSELNIGDNRLDLNPFQYSSGIDSPFLT